LFFVLIVFMIVPVGLGASMPEESSEHRRTPRHRVLKEGRIVIRDHSTIDCVVRDLSQTGAKLRLPDSIHLPETFDLLLVRDATIVPVRLAWRKGDLVGVAFAGNPKPFVRKSIK
jgi:PilZ domain